MVLFLHPIVGLEIAEPRLLDPVDASSSACHLRLIASSISSVRVAFWKTHPRSANALQHVSRCAAMFPPPMPPPPEPLLLVIAAGEEPGGGT